MFALGCIQAQTCHTGFCPTGVTTQDPLRQQALVVGDKSVRVKNFHHETLHALKELIEATGLNSPHDIRPHHIMRRINEREALPLSVLYPDIRVGSLVDARPADLATAGPLFEYYFEQADPHQWALPNRMATA